jgi:alanine dehydrogenase
VLTVHREYKTYAVIAVSMGGTYIGIDSAQIAIFCAADVKILNMSILI